jgi:hypothetical protein
MVVLCIEARMVMALRFEMKQSNCFACYPEGVVEAAKLIVTNGMEGAALIACVMLRIDSA